MEKRKWEFLANKKAAIFSFLLRWSSKTMQGIDCACYQKHVRKPMLDMHYYYIYCVLVLCSVCEKGRTVRKGEKRICATPTTTKI